MYWLRMYIIITSAKIIQLNVHIFRQRVTHDCSSILDSNTTLRELHVPMFFLTVHPYITIHSLLHLYILYPFVNRKHVNMLMLYSVQV